MTIVVRATITIGLLSATASADPPGMTPALPPGYTYAAPDDVPDIDPRIVATGSDTSRVMVGAAIAMFASYPLGIEDPGPAVVVSKPLWLGARKAHFQWVLDATLIAGAGTYSHSAQLAALPHFGFNMYWGPRVGVEARFGPTGFAQLGSRSVVGLGMGGGGAFVIRPFADDRQRIKLFGSMNMGFPFADDSMNDSIGMGAMVAGAGYELPY